MYGLKKISDNGIIIIGNGFDLAHNMRSSYMDFSNWFLVEKVMKNLISNNLSEDIFSTNFIGRYKYVKDTPRTTYTNYPPIEIIKLVLKYLYDSNSSVKKEDIYETLVNKRVYLQSMIVNRFLGDLYANTHNNWFDIEQAYFDELVKWSKSLGKSHPDTIITNLKKLNNNFNEIKELLEEYLNTIQIKESLEIKKFFNHNFLGKKNIKIINFNYTNTFSQYFNSLFNQNGDHISLGEENVNYIHGELNKRVIFGYGDDNNEEYIRMKNSGINEFLENFKTFGYLHDSKYREMVDYISGIDNYEVYVLGHSLGVTDKTLLKEIMDTDKCLNIHLFKRSDIDESSKISDMTKLHFNLSRILEHDRSSRNKIIPLDISSHFPYVKGDEIIINKKCDQIYGKDWRS
jgi:hypothetical protein